MRIDSGLSGYSYHGRVYEIERDTDEAPVREAAPAPRFPVSPVISSTILSASLSRALWVVDGGKSDHTAAEDISETSVADQIQARYLEHSDLGDAELH